MMRPTRVQLAAAVGALAALTLGVAAALGQETRADETNEATATQPPPKLFDFAYYKRTFGKRYGSLLEEASRRVLFLARAFETFVAGLAYRRRQSGHYLKLNQASDWTRDELAARRNRVLLRYSSGGGSGGELETGPSASGEGVAPEGSASAEELAVREQLGELGRAIERQVDELAHGARNGADFGDLLAPASSQGGVARAKRSLDAQGAEARAEQSERPLPLERLVAGKQVGESAATRARMVARVPSNNPLYGRLELASEGLRDQQVAPRMWRVSVRPADVRSLVAGYNRDKAAAAVAQAYAAGSRRDPPTTARPVRLTTEQMRERRELEARRGTGAAAAAAAKNSDDDDEDKRDRMFVDHRQSGCMFAPRDQGKRCGACYAFAATTLAEWLHCNQTGSLVAFSEQYMIDCGNGRIDGNKMAGCEGSKDELVPKFLHNFGVELRAHYPYTGNDGQCPYAESADLLSTGYIRMNLADFVEVPVELWPEHLAHGPLYLAIASPDDFDFYGGGVDDGSKCAAHPDHAVLLVGHGREDGKDFWLIRNSYGTDWGDAGYFKLSKRAPKRCIADQRALALGTRDAKQYRQVSPRRNPLNEESIVVKRKLW